MASTISGNAPLEVKEQLSSPTRLLWMVDANNKVQGFGRETMAGLSVTEVSIIKNAEEPSRDEARVVCRLVVTEEMLNGGMMLHGGCSAFLVDVCSTFAIVAYGVVYPDKMRMNVSQSINMTYHSPASLGDELKIVNTSMSIGAKSMTARTEIWNVTKKRLVVSGVHVKMEPSQPRQIKL